MHFERATELDSNYGAAYGELAIAHALNSVYAAVADVGTDWSAAFTRALEINPNDSNALAAKAYYITLTKSDWKQAGALYERAVQFGISSHAAILYGTMYLAPLSKWAEMQAFYNAILNVDPYRTDILMDYAEWHMNHGTHHEAIALWKRVLEVQPDATDAWAGIGDSYAALGDHSAARAALQKVQLPMKLAWYSNRYLKALWALGDRETVMHLVAEYEREPKYRAPLIFIYLIIGEIDKALSSFEAAYAASDWPSLFIKSVPSTAVLQGHPRYEALLEKMHLDDPSLREAGLL
jgi:tetratricopeptide (TPR) repeat protein